jgi:hypothetical protein
MHWNCNHQFRDSDALWQFLLHNHLDYLLEFVIQEGAGISQKLQLIQMQKLWTRLNSI